jgi:hypothetical protein
MLQGHMAVGTELNNYVEITKYSRWYILHNILPTQPVCRWSAGSWIYIRSLMRICTLTWKVIRSNAEKFPTALYYSYCRKQRLYAQVIVPFSWLANHISFPESKAFPELHICLTVPLFVLYSCSFGL